MPARDEGSTLSKQASSANAVGVGRFHVRTPKRRATSASKAEESYPYYAGYAESFARDALQRLSEPGVVVFDPWNGAGTTTHAAATMNRPACGTDLNPVMVIVAKAKCASPADIAAAREQFANVSRPNRGESTEDDALIPWVGAEGAGFIRRLVQSALPSRRGLETTTSELAEVGRAVSNASPGSCLLVLAIFRAVKTGAASKASSNPTWTKQPTAPARWYTAQEWRTQIAAQIDRLAEISLQMAEAWPVDSRLINIECASSEAVPLESESVDVVLTSPPYCTRIDYAVATLIELAVLGLSTSTVNSTLRRELLGTTAIREKSASRMQSWGTTCNNLLEQIYNHPSSGSRSYYYKNFVQYFDSLHRSLGELGRVVKIGGVVCSVLQGSHYKEYPVDLPQIFLEMAISHGFSLTGIASFNVGQNMGSINQKSLKYRKPVRATEKVLVLQRCG